MKLAATLFLFLAFLVASHTAMPEQRTPHPKLCPKWKPNCHKSKPVPQRPTPPKKQTRLLTPAQLQKLITLIKARQGCSGNFCIAIDGSGSLTPTEFENEKNFVFDFLAIFSGYSFIEIAAVQYATTNTRIHTLTGDQEGFNLALQNTKQMRGRSFLVGGVNYCFSQLLRRRYEPINMIILADGESIIGGDAIKRADLFRRIGGDIWVVASGFKPNDKNRLALVGGDKSKVYEVNSFLDKLVLDQIIDEIVHNICSSSK